MTRKRTDWLSEPIINRFFQLEREEFERRRVQLYRLHFSYGQEKAVRFHRDRLGMPDYVWKGEHRCQVWETPDWRVYVADAMGACFEVREDLTDEQAMAAWEDYLDKLDLL